MTVTASDIQSIYDEFSSVSTTLIDDAIAQMDDLVSNNFFTDFRDRLIRLGAAHLLTIWQRDKLKTQGMIGLAAQGKQPKLDINNEDFWQLTGYGQAFWTQLQSVGGIGAITV